MFKKTRRKIVITIMSILVVVWGGTLSMIYISSYMEMTKQNREMLSVYANMYRLPPETDMSYEHGIPGDIPRNKEDKLRFDPFFTESPRYKLSLFYSVALTYDGKVIDVKNNPATVHSDTDLERIAQSIQKGKKNSGRNDNLYFYKMDKNGYVLVTFMDNTVVNENVLTLFRFTFVFGGMVLILFFFLAVYLAKRIVQPLEEGYQKQKQFISDAGHELKTPVSIVSTNAELLAREVGENQWLANIQYENERMGMLIAQLLNLARTENTTPMKERLQLSYIVPKEILPLEGIAFERGMNLVSEIDDDIYIEGDSTQIKQMITILLDNAIRHGTRNSEILVRLSRERGFSVLSVVNHGEEIPKEQQDKIFERFFRMDTIRNQEDNHYGLGLAIAKAIVLAHHGKIQVKCYDGLVEFRVKLPMAQKYK